MSDPFVVSREVSRALAGGKAVVALETTVVTHGLPHPEGLEMALQLEDIIRLNNATPATIGILDGTVRVGMSSESIDELAHAEATKVNLGNLAAVLASGRAGSTTVAATMAAASRTGIRVFATGGIGGVHRRAAETGDVSADLTALARFPVAVVCAGAKAVLDLGRTVEALETAGVPIVGYRTDDFPAFYRRRSGLGVDARCDSPEELAEVVRTHFALEWGAAGRGIVVANPIPRSSEMPHELYEESLASALGALEQETIRGRQVTPFLLRTLDVLTAGKSVFSNRALLASNAEVAALLACELR